MGKIRTIDFITELQSAEKNGLKRDGCFKAFVDFVKERPELELLFRGNSNEATIYYHNNIVWKLSMNGSLAKVTINYDHLRYTVNWETIIEKYHNQYGFPLKTKDDLSKKFSLGYQCTEVDTSKGESFDKSFVEGMYEIICDVMSDYFFPYLTGEIADENDTRLMDNFRDSVGVDQNRSTKGKLIKKRNPLEKQKQQAYFTANTNIKDGLFVYDLEYKEPSLDNKDKKEKLEKKHRNNMNKPDGLGIRFRNGNPTKFVMIEMKSKPEAEKSTSGTHEHLDGMLDDLFDYTFVHDRLLEADQLLRDYAKLGLRGLNDSMRIPSCLDNIGVNETEILVVYTDELASENQVGRHVTYSDKYGTIGYMVELF